jgi:aldehyde dehydrogenase (NAD+)
MQLHYIGNESVASSSGLTLPVIDPSDGQPFDEIQRGNAADIDAAVRAARHCFDTAWHKVSAAERGRLLYKLAQKIAAHADELALLEQRDCGKPV